MATSFDPTWCGPNTVLSNGNLTVAGSNSGGVDETVRTVDAISTSLLQYYEGLKQATDGNDWALMGVCDSVAAKNWWTGGDTHSIGLSTDTGQIWYNNAVIGSITAPAVNDTVCVAFNRSTNLIWWRVNGGSWSGNGGTGNPATGAFGYSFSGINSGAAYVCTSQGQALDKATFRFAASSWVFTPPSGAIAVGPTTTLSLQRSQLILL